MKKLILLLIFLSSSLYPIDIIDFQLSVEIGLIPRGHLKIYEFNRSIYRGMSFYGDFNFESQWFDNRFFAGAGAKIYIWKVKESYSFKPDEIDFIFFAGFNIGNSIEIGGRVYCKHPIIAWMESSFEELIWEQSLIETYINITLNSKQLGD